MALKIVVFLSIVCVAFACKAAVQSHHINDMRSTFESIEQDYVTYELPEAVKLEGEYILTVERTSYDVCDSQSAVTWRYNVCLSEVHGTAMKNLKSLKIKHLTSTPATPSTQ